MRKTYRWLGMLAAVSGLLVILVPLLLLPVCQQKVETKTGALLPMPCRHTARAEMAMGGLLILAGVLLYAFGQEATTGMSLSLVILGVGVGVMLMPTVLIGTCRMPEHPCNVGTKPALLLLGVWTMGIGGVGLWLTRAKNRISGAQR